MKSSNPAIVSVPTNIITGFLGVGKTTSILQLLKAKPATERWAVLVNEFGEVGVDGDLFQGQHSTTQGVFVREVPGGCMCCAAGLPMQVALNQLLSSSKPQRLLIEPTGLGHPREVLEVLSDAHYKEVLDVQRCVTLVDARKLADSRYVEHTTFNQQIDIADIVVANKEDLYEPEDRARLESYIHERKGEQTPIVFTRQGRFDPDILTGSSVAATVSSTHHHHHHHDDNRFPPLDEMIPEEGFLKMENFGEGYRSIGWRFAPQYVFDRQALYGWMSGLSVERLKAVFITNQGVFGYNLTEDALTEVELDDCLESKVEILGNADGENPSFEWKSLLSEC